MLVVADSVTYILPDFGLSRNRCGCAHLLRAKHVNYTALASIGVANETGADLLAIGM